MKVPAHGVAGYRAAVIAAYGVTLATLLASVWFGYLEMLTYGTDGALPAVPPGVVAVIAAFALTTAAALVLWARAVR